MPLPKPGTAVNLVTQTFEGVPNGMNLALPANEIADTQAQYLQDIILDYPGLVRRRGPLMPVPSFAQFSTYLTSGITHTLDPLGVSKLMVLRGDSSNAFASLLSSDFTTAVDFTLPGNLPTTAPLPNVDSKSSINNGVWVGTAATYNKGSAQNLMRWNGGNKADYTTGTITVARGSTAVTGAGTTWSTNVVPGMYLFANTDDPYTSTLVGMVVAVVSDTSLTLEAASPYASTAKAYKLTSVRGFAPKVVKGRITAATASPTVTGGNTKFRSQGLGTGTWQLYRASDMAFVGKVSTVNNEISITLTGNAAIAMNNDNFVALRADADWSISTQATAAKMGFLNGSYAGRQWFANNSSTAINGYRLFFSDLSDPEAVDMDTYAGDYITINSTNGVNSPIKAICGAYNALLVFKETESFGVFGTTPTTFQVKKIEDDGVLSGMSVQSYGGGVLWAGRQGIFFYNGTSVDNITAGSLGAYYKTMLQSVDTSKYKMWSMVARDHYFLHIERAQPNKPIIKGVTSVTPTNMTIVINLLSRAVTVFSNTCIRGGVQLPQSSSYETLFVVNSGTHGYICSSVPLFDANANAFNDQILCDVSAALGPDFYFESKKYSEGDSMRKKLFKQLSMNYLCQGDSLRVDTVLGLNEIGNTSTDAFKPTVYTWDSLASAFSTWDNLAAHIPTWDLVIFSVFNPARIKFLKRSQNMAFRIWQNSSNITRVRLGPFQIGFKWQRPGRI